MKNYVKPTMEVISLKPEEQMACPCCVNYSKNNVHNSCGSKKCKPTHHMGNS